MVDRSAQRHSKPIAPNSWAGPHGCGSASHGPPPPLSNSEGPVLDPIVSIRSSLTIEPGETAVVDMVTGVSANTRRGVGHDRKYHDRHLADRLLDSLGRTVRLSCNNSMRPRPKPISRPSCQPRSFTPATPAANASILVKNGRGQSGLWGYGISGDLPIVLVRIAAQNKIHLVEQLIRSYAYWRFKGLAVDLVIWNEDQSGYRQLLHDEVMNLIGNSTEAHLLDRPGGILVRRPEQLSEEDRILLQTVARVVLSDSSGTLSDQVERRGAQYRDAGPHPLRSPKSGSRPSDGLPHRDLIYANGIGGFTPDGREYVITMTSSQRTPAPWANVLANSQFGTVVTESGLRLHVVRERA